MITMIPNLLGIMIIMVNMGGLITMITMIPNRLGIMVIMVNKGGSDYHDYHDS